MSKIHGAITIDSGMDSFNAELSEMMKHMDQNTVGSAVEDAVKQYVDDGHKLPYPMSKIRKPGYVHLVQEIDYEKYTATSFKVGWDEFYGFMVENGTSHSKAQPHLLPLYERNKDKYIEMVKKDLQLD